jgi:hypothetical protein
MSASLPCAAPLVSKPLPRVLLQKDARAGDEAIPERAAAVSHFHSFIQLLHELSSSNAAGRVLLSKEGAGAPHRPCAPHFAQGLVRVRVAMR